jgi:hypothetical protein
VHAGSRARAAGTKRLRRAAIIPSVQRGVFAIKAVSLPDVVPQGYLSQHLARRACEAAGKRLCTEAEWTYACRGSRQLKYPYGSHYLAGRCNIHRALHPASVLHQSSAIGHTDPRLNLVVESIGDRLDPLLRVTGGTPSCASVWVGDKIYDMVGNLDEWVDDPKGVFVGGFYARSTRLRSEDRPCAEPSHWSSCCKSAR